VVAKKAVAITHVATLRLAHIKATQSAMILTRIAVAAVNLPAQAPSVARARATVTRKKPALVLPPLAQLILTLRTVTTVAQAFSVPPANAPLAISSANRSWAPTLRATTPTPATPPLAWSLAGPPNSDPTNATACSKTSSTAQIAAAEANATTDAVAAPPSAAKSRPGSTTTKPSSSACALVLVASSSWLSWVVSPAAAAGVAPTRNSLRLLRSLLLVDGKAGKAAKEVVSRPCNNIPAKAGRTKVRTRAGMLRLYRRLHTRVVRDMRRHSPSFAL
jgi:hypothetical protein